MNKKKLVKISFLIIFIFLLFTSYSRKSYTTISNIENINKPKNTVKPQEEIKTSTLFEIEEIGTEKFEVNYELQTYYDTLFKFTVDYPKDMLSEKSEPGGPQSGIYIYIDNDKKNGLYVFGCAGSVDYSYENGKWAQIKTNQGTVFSVSHRINGNKRDMFFSVDQFHGAVLSCDIEVFEVNKGKIYAIIKSIKTK